MNGDIVSVMKRLYQAMLSKIKDDEERSNDPDWLLVNVHVAPPAVVEAMESPDTPPNVKHLLFLSTFTGRQWVHKDEVQGLTEGRLIIKDSPIEDWSIDER